MKFICTTTHCPLRNYECLPTLAVWAVSMVIWLCLIWQWVYDSQFFKADLAILEMSCLLTDFLVCAYIYVCVCVRLQTENKSVVYCLVPSTLCCVFIRMCPFSLFYCLLLLHQSRHWQSSVIDVHKYFSSAVSNYFSWSNHLWFMILYTPLHFCSWGTVIFCTVFCFFSRDNVNHLRLMRLFVYISWFSRALGTGKCQWKKVQLQG